jgi:hypothetical protein
VPVRKPLALRDPPRVLFASKRYRLPSTIALNLKQVIANIFGTGRFVLGDRRRVSYGTTAVLSFQISVSNLPPTQFTLAGQDDWGRIPKLGD